MRICELCKIQKSETCFSSFFKKGVRGFCLECKATRKRINDARRVSEYRMRHPNRVKESQRKWHEKTRLWETKERKKYMAEYHAANAEKLRAKVRAWRKENVGLHNASNAFRKRLVKQATPKWLKENKSHPAWQKIKEIYKSCPSGYSVDHIDPIKNDLVCGLHVPWNLMPIPKEMNSRKHNKFELFRCETIGNLPVALREIA